MAKSLDLVFVCRGGGYINGKLHNTQVYTFAQQIICSYIFVSNVDSLLIDFWNLSDYQ